MYTKNQLIIAGLLIAGASSIVTYMVTKGKETTSGFFGEKRKRKISTTSGEPISYASGTKKIKQIIRTEKGEMKGSQQSMRLQGCDGQWVQVPNQHSSGTHWQCVNGMLVDNPAEGAEVH